MSLTLHDFPTIVASMISDITALNSTITDMTEGSVIRSLLETCAQEIQRLELSAFQGVKEAINVGTYKNFNFGALPAQYASGLITFYSTTAQSQSQIIPAGTQVAVPNTTIIYTVNSNTVFPVGATSVNVFCIAQAPGTSNNTPANTITLLMNSLPFVTSINNNTAIINGTSQESSQARQNRFSTYLAGLSMGTSYALQAGAETVSLFDANGNILEHVNNALVVEGFLQDPTQPLGLVQVFIDNGSGTASDNLVDQTISVLEGYTDSAGVLHPGYIAAGVSLYVAAVSPQPLNINATLTIAPGFSASVIIPQVQSAISTYLQTLQVGQTAILSEITYNVLSVTGVVDIQYLTPTGNVTPTSGFRIVTGNLIINP